MTWCSSDFSSNPVIYLNIYGNKSHSWFWEDKPNDLVDPECFSSATMRLAILSVQYNQIPAYHMTV